MISLRDLFKVGIGPSSSHTFGPMLAASQFVDLLEKTDELSRAARIGVMLYGSLAATAEGHGTIRAIILGLHGHHPASVDPDRIEAIVEAGRSDKFIRRGDVKVSFDPSADIKLMKRENLPRHPNAMQFDAYSSDGQCTRSERFYSIGGGFIEHEGEQLQSNSPKAVPFPFRSGQELLSLCDRSGLNVSQIVYANELALHPAKTPHEYVDFIRAAMRSCIARGLSSEGILPGRLGLQRRAKRLADRLKGAVGNNSLPLQPLDWVSAFAMAVNEENAAGGRVVTAPTNGAAGVIPAVLEYYERFCSGSCDEGSRDFLLTAVAIGVLIKQNASISGAEVGCQGEVGAASSMAAAGLTAALGGTPQHIEHAAEIAMEHHLGMTCDPVEGLVQIPCIERNAFGAMKAISAASLALHGDGRHAVSFDEVIEAMRVTGIDMLNKYKETSQGGLAAVLARC